MRQWHIVKPDDVPNRIWLAQGEEEHRAPAFNVGINQLSDQIHNDLSFAINLGPGPSSHQSTAYWPTSHLAAILCQYSNGRYRNRSLETKNRTSTSLQPLPLAASKHI
jgi:hypothetical protein